MLSTEEIQQIKNKKTKSVLRRSKREFEDANYLKRKMEQLLQPPRSGFIEAEGPFESSLKVTQDVIKEAVPITAALKLDDGPYSINYTRNGRHLAIGGSTGHMAAFDWKTGKLLCELNVEEPIHDIRWLHNENLFAAAQKKHVFIYDSNGVEVHALKGHTEATHLDFLPYHMLLVSAGRSGILRYQDISTGRMAAEWPTRIGPTMSLCQNPQNAIMHLGHASGIVTFWNPTTNGPLVKMLCGRGPVSSIAINQAGNVMATTGPDTCIKLWDLRTYKLLESYKCPLMPTSIDISQTGLLSVTFGSTLLIWKDSWKEKQSVPYMKHVSKGSPLHKGIFCPFDDILGLSHTEGFSSLLVPGAGEPYYDSMETNPFETKRQRQEGEIKQLLEKLQPDMIILEPHAIGQLRKDRSLNVNPADTELTPEELAAKKELRKKKGIKKYLNKQKNVFDLKKQLIKEKLGREADQKQSLSVHDIPVLDRFKRK